MKAIRHVAWWALLSIGLIGAISPLPRIERVQPPAEHHWSVPATETEKREHLEQQLFDELDAWRADLNGAQR